MLGEATGPAVEDTGRLSRPSHGTYRDLLWVQLRAAGGSLVSAVVALEYSPGSVSAVPASRRLSGHGSADL